MNNKIGNIFLTSFFISGISGFILGLLLIIFSFYDDFILVDTGRILYEIIFGPIFIGTYYMQRVPSYIIGMFYFLFSILSFITINLFNKKKDLTRGLGMFCCTVGLVAILLSRPMRYEILYFVTLIWLIQLLILVLLWNKLLYKGMKNEN